MEVLTKLGPIDLFIIILLALGVFAGFTAGLVRYGLNIVVVIVAFIIASQLRVPLYNVLSFWHAFTQDLREQLLFLGLFLVLAISGWFMVRSFYGSRSSASSTRSEARSSASCLPRSRSCSPWS